MAGPETGKARVEPEGAMAEARGAGEAAGTGPRVLVLSSVYPNPEQPVLGVFVQERVRRVARHCDLMVAAPVPWFPLDQLVRRVRHAGIPRVETRQGVRVHHPRFFCIPRYLKWLDGVFYAASLLPFLRRLRRQFPFDVIDSHFVFPDGMAAALLGRVFRCPVVITLRGSIVRLATYPLHRPQLRFALSAAARVLAVSESLKGTAVGLGIPAGKIRVIPNGVDTDHFFPRDRDEARRALGLPADRPVLLSVGGLSEGKGHARVVSLLPRLLRRQPDLLYVVVGGDPPGDSSRRLIRALVERHGLARHVLLAGERPHREVPLWLAAADLFCLATRSEGWANVLLEALACGRPVVTTRVGGNPEIITDESLGILVPAGDDQALGVAIEDALGRRWDPAAMVAHARAHSWETAAQEALGELRRLAPAPSGQRAPAPEPAGRPAGRRP